MSVCVCIHICCQRRFGMYICMCRRRFGGVHLGPARFKYIANTARELLDACGHGAERRVGGGGGGSRAQAAKVGEKKKKR